MWCDIMTNAKVVSFPIQHIIWDYDKFELLPPAILYLEVNFELHYQYLDILIDRLW